MNELQQRLLLTQQQLERFNTLSPQVRTFAWKQNLAPMERWKQQELRNLDPKKLQDDFANLTKQLQDQKSQQEFAQKYNSGLEASTSSINQKQAEDLANKFGYDFTWAGVNPVSQTATWWKWGKTKDMFDELSNIFWSINNEYGQGLSNLDRDITWKLEWAQAVAQSQFGEWGKQDERLSSFYKSMGDYMSSQQGKEQAISQAQAQRLGADVWTRSNIAADISRKQMQDVANLKGKEIQDYDNLYKTIDQLSQNFIQNYKWVKDDYYKNFIDWIAKMKVNLAAQSMDAQRAILEKEYSASGGSPQGTRTAPQNALENYMNWQNAQWAVQQSPWVARFAKWSDIIEIKPNENWWYTVNINWINTSTDEAWAQRLLVWASAI